MPAYNAEKTINKTYGDIPHDMIDEIILVDDCSSDKTVESAKKLNLNVFVHDRNKGYGANQKTCYKQALNLGADIVVMLHPDYQYNPKLIAPMAHLVASEAYDVVIASRIIGIGALSGGMPFYKYIFNKILTFMENIIVGQNLSEYHSGFRAFSKAALNALPLDKNSDDFVFDNQMLFQAIYFDFKIGEISCPTNYNKDASSINFKRSLVYGLGVLLTAVKFRIAKMGVKIMIFNNT